MKHAKTYRTKQQTAILNYIKSVDNGHVTVNQIAEHLKENGQTVGLTTIYRQLDRFQREGLVQKIVLDGNSGAYYQYTGDNASRQDCGFLLKCEGCGIIMDMNCNHMTDLYFHVLQEHHFNVNPHRTMFYGTCEQCLYNDNINLLTERKNSSED